MLEATASPRPLHELSGDNGRHAGRQSGPAWRLGQCGVTETVTLSA